MKLSQPKSARTINKARVLGVLRKNENLSKADLARILGLNKVSVGEIVDSLIEDHFVEETGKIESSNGRRPTALRLVSNSAFVLSVDIGRRNTTVSLCDLKAQPIKFERMPTKCDVKVEEFCVSIIKSCVRVMKLVDSSQVLGVGISVGGRISFDNTTILECPYLPWKNIPICEAFSQVLKIKAIVSNSTASLITAERFVSSEGSLLEGSILGNTLQEGSSHEKSLLESSGPIMYLDWGDGFKLAFVEDGKVFGSCNNFAHLKVSQTGLCWCGEIGCLEACASAWALSNNMDSHLKDLWPVVDEEVLSYLGKALNIASQVSGSSKVIIGGEGSTIDDTHLKTLRSFCKGLEIERSNLGDKANMISAAETALDNWFYMTTLLEEVKDLL